MNTYGLTANPNYVEESSEEEEAKSNEEQKDQNEDNNDEEAQIGMDFLDDDVMRD